MTENPYAPPSADLASRDALSGARGTGDFEIGLCISEAWAGTWANFPLWLGVGIVLTVLSMLSVLTIVGIGLALPHLIFGSAYFLLRMHDREAQFADIFVGFSNYGRVLVNMSALFLIMFLIGIVTQALYYIGAATDNTTLMVVGYIIGTPISLFISARLSLAYLYLVDEDTSAIESLQLAWERTNLSKWKCVGLMLMMIPIMLVGALAFGIGIIPASVMSYLMWASAYRQIEGRAATA